MHRSRAVPSKRDVIGRYRVLGPAGCGSRTVVGDDGMSGRRSVVHALLGGATDPLTASRRPPVSDCCIRLAARVHDVTLRLEDNEACGSRSRC